MFKLKSITTKKCKKIIPGNWFYGDWPLGGMALANACGVQNKCSGQFNRWMTNERKKNFNEKMGDVCLFVCLGRLKFENEASNHLNCNVVIDLYFIVIHKSILFMRKIHKLNHKAHGLFKRIVCNVETIIGLWRTSISSQQLQSV